MLKIYIANLGKYNEGELVGKWVELPCEDLDEVLKEIEVVDGTAYEEYAIHDYESDMEQDNEFIPSPSSPENIQLGKNDTLCYLDINMFSIRSKMKNL